MQIEITNESFQSCKSCGSENIKVSIRARLDTHEFYAHCKDCTELTFSFESNIKGGQMDVKIYELNDV